MTPQLPDYDAGRDRVVEVQGMIDRFARAKWITGLNIDCPEYFHLNLTELGSERMRQLGEIVRPFADCAFDGARRPSTMDWLRFIFRIGPIARCLHPPALSKTEINVLVCMAALHERNRRKEDCGLSSSCLPRNRNAT